MKNFNKKQLAMVLAIAGLIHVSQANAGLWDDFTTKAVDFIKAQAMPYLSYLKKPETYIAVAALAAAAVGAYHFRHDIYWAFKNELSLERAQNRVRSRLTGAMKDRHLVTQFYNAVTAEELFVDNQSADYLIQKNAIDACVQKHFMLYEFSSQRSYDWMCRAIEVVNHSVRVQNGLTCGYHAAWNGAHIYALLNQHPDLDCFVLQVGPPIHEWKTCIEAFENGLWQTQLGCNLNASLSASKQSNNAYENISDAAIQHLLEHQLQAVLPKNNVTVIPNLFQYSAELDDNLLPLINDLKDGCKKLHAFIVGNMKSFDSYGTSGHWVALVIERCESENGAIIFRIHTADSLGSRCNSQVNGLVNILNENGLFN